MSLGSHWSSFGSSGIFGFTRACGFSPFRLWNRWVQPGSMSSLRFCLGVVGFIQGCWVHSGSLSGSLGSSGFAWFTRVRPGGGWVHTVFCVHSGSAWGSLGSSWLFGFTRARTGGRRVHPCSLGSLGYALVVVGFIRGRWVHSGSQWGYS